jgi:hypothetical protein
LDAEKKNLKGLIKVPTIGGRSRRGIGPENFQYRSGGVIFHPYHKSATAKVNTAKGKLKIADIYLDYLVNDKLIKKIGELYGRNQLKIKV